jgi:hypothetical protein
LVGVCVINTLLREWGIFDQPSDLPKFFGVNGLIQRQDSSPLAGILIRANHESDQGSIKLAEDTADQDGSYIISYEQIPGIATIKLRVLAIGSDGNPIQSSILIPGAKRLEMVNLTVPITVTPMFPASAEAESTTSLTSS